MLPNDKVSMSVGHLDHVLTVYSSMEHVTWKSPGPCVAELAGSCIPTDAYQDLPDPKCLLSILYCLVLSDGQGKYAQLCEVRSFCSTDCTNWMNLFNTIRRVTGHFGDNFTWKYFLTFVLHFTPPRHSYVIGLNIVQWWKWKDIRGRHGRMVSRKI